MLSQLQEMLMALLPHIYERLVPLKSAPFSHSKISITCRLSFKVHSIVFEPDAEFSFVQNEIKGTPLVNDLLSSYYELHVHVLTELRDVGCIDSPFCVSKGHDSSPNSTQLLSRKGGLNPTISICRL